MHFLASSILGCHACVHPPTDTTAPQVARCPTQSLSSGLETAPPLCLFGTGWEQLSAVASSIWEMLHYPIEPALVSTFY